MTTTWRSIVRKEVREIARDGRMRVLGVLVVVLALAALAFGVHQTHRAQQARQEASEMARANWEGQGDKNPHVAAHYGTYVFAPTSAATAIDPGVSAHLGQSVRITAHKRSLAAHSQASDAGGLQRLGSFSVAGVLLQLVPLLIIALGYGLWSRERERGTLRQLLSTGVDRRALLWGKLTALGLVVAAVMTPAAAVILAVLWFVGGGDGGTLLRLGLLGVGYVVYFGVFSALTLSASALASSSRASLVAMVGVWGLFCLVIPRAATEVAAALQPLPSQAALERAMKDSLERGIDGKAERETAIEAIVSDLKAKAGVSDAGMLMAPSFNNGFELQAEAMWEDQVFDHHMAQFEDQIQAQESLAVLLGACSPYVAMRALSAGLSGTDYAHHRHFTAQAEAWRKSFIAQLNAAFAKNAGAEGWDYKAGSELWKEAPPFEYTAPGAGLALTTHQASLVVLLIWLMASLVLAASSARRVRVS